MGCCSSSDMPDNDKYRPTHHVDNGGVVRTQYPSGPNDFSRQGSFGRTAHTSIGTVRHNTVVNLHSGCLAACCTILLPSLKQEITYSFVHIYIYICIYI